MLRLRLFLLCCFLTFSSQAFADFSLLVGPSKHQKTGGATGVSGVFNILAGTDIAIDPGNAELFRITSATITLGANDPDVTVSLSQDLADHLASAGNAPQFELGPTRTINLLEWNIAPTASYPDITHFSFEMNYISGGLAVPVLGGGPPLSPGGTFSFDGFVAVPEPSGLGLIAMLGGMGFLRHRRRLS